MPMRVDEYGLPRISLLGDSVNRANYCNPLALSLAFGRFRRGTISAHVTNKDRRRRPRGQEEQQPKQRRRGSGQGKGQKAKEAIGAVTAGDKEKKSEGALDKVKGKAKEAIGALTANEEKKAEGRSEQTKGTAKDKLGKVKDLLK